MTNQSTPVQTTAEERYTGDLYGSIWNGLSESAFQELSELHWKRFHASGLPADFLKEKVCLDAGCGSGRAVRSMLLGGAKRVVAVDIGKDCLANTERRNAQFRDRLEVHQGSVLELPYAEGTFDFVHCDGVLHHTRDPFGGLVELVRVAKPGAPIMFGLYGSGGLLNFAIYSARLFNKVIPRPLADGVLGLFTKDPIKHYVFLDPFYVPIRETYRPREIEEWALRAGLEGLRRIFISTDYRGWDRLLKDYSSYGPWFRGEGYLMYIAFKQRP
jgi:SAM-dependent methyltransferase